MQGKILTFGELLLRYSPDAQSEWLATNKMSVFVGGAEANVATALALWDRDVSYMTAVPDNLVCRQILNNLSQKNIDTSRVHFSGERLGIFYLPVGSDMKNAGTIYDRKYSSFFQLELKQINWDAVFDDVTWFHFSALTPALNETLVAVCEEALQAAQQRSITISVDLNYRPQLWKYGRLPNEVMPQLVQYCNVVMGNIWAAQKMLDIEFSETLTENVSTIEEYKAQATDSSKKIMERFPAVMTVANTFRFDGEQRNDIEYYATLYSGGTLNTSQVYHTDSIIDKVGSGDCFMAGLIDGLYAEKEAQDVVAFATGAAFNKLFIKGDTTNSKRSEIETFMKKFD